MLWGLRGIDDAIFRRFHTNDYGDDTDGWDIAPTRGASVTTLVPSYRCVDRGCPTALHTRRSERSSVRTACSTPSRTTAGLSLFP